MISDTLYPITDTLSRQLVAPYDLTNAVILEPGAGKADLCQGILKHGRYSRHCDKDKPQIYCCEIEPELQAILREKGYPLVGTDFLEYAPMRHYTHIVGNPPFNAAERHLLHAWEILYAGHIAFIMPRSSLEGKYAAERVVLNLIEQHGSIEDCGRAFAHGAERYTAEEVVIVRLEKKPAEGVDLNFTPVNDRQFATFDDKDKGQELSLEGYIESRLAAYTASVNAYEAYNLARQKIVRYVAPLARFYRPDGDAHRGDTHVDIIADTDKMEGLGARYNAFIDLITESAWTSVLNHPGFSAIMTNRTKEALLKFRREQRRVDFNEQNIRRFLESLALKQGELLMGAVLDSFDIMTKYSEESKEAAEGWKSNDAYKVNKRVVLPGFIHPFDRFHTYFSFSYYHERELDDIDRGLCLVAKRRFDDITTIHTALSNKWGGAWSCSTPGECESSFFRIKFYKKGTIHLYWLDENLRRDFNIAAAQGRGWLPSEGHSG
jgi:hypothetical protein